ncbi:Maltase 2 [Gryllus bimaculatus]|nr:Maltase 2 [Gryllus bimaculatus]
MKRLLTLATALAAALAVAVAAPAGSDVAPEAAPQQRLFQPALLHQPKLKWWQTGIVYQIYPASFKDSNDDGIGDLKGITDKLQYLKDLGVAALWLSPIFQSPNKDMGYDISDYKDIHPNYGNLTDFEEMVKKAHELGLKVILDFVPNHSSDEHRWFKEALKGPDNPYHDYYIWHEGKIVNGERQPPTNWGSVFDEMKEGSAWKWVPSLNKYYYRTFHEGQPDLNYTNPAVVTEMKGVDGFRIDAIPYLFEDRLMRDNVKDGNERTENLPETYDMVRQWREVFDEEGARLGKDLVMMLEAYATVEETMKYYGTKDFPAGEKNVDGLNMLVLLLPGTAVTYYGEELGMLDNTELTLKDCMDPQACPSGATEDYYKKHSRDFERTPMQWNKNDYAGFSNVKPWLPVPESYTDRNVDVEEKDESSHLNIYKKLVKLRNEPVVQTGTLKAEDVGNVVSFLRQNDTYSLLVLINLKETSTTFNVIDIYGFVGELKEIVSSNFQDNTLNLKSVSLNGNAAVVLGGPRFQWWQTGIVYQIYPRSFKDSGEDGNGDIPGITAKLDYLKDLGVQTIWLSPIYKSPDYDMGYDISDFKDIHDDFGTMTDFRAMVKKAHDLGLKVVLDFVPNHSSSDHPWFKAALKKDEKYLNYYVWRPGKADNQPPNNWRSVFASQKEGSAWTYSKEVGQHYLHQFHEHQPDLNFNNPEVVQEMKDVLKFWVDEGVDGFRVDAITHLFEDDQFRDNDDKNNYLTNQAKTYEMVQEWREFLDNLGKAKGKELVLMLEASADGDDLTKYFGTADKPGGHFPFNFKLIHDLGDKYNDPEKDVSAKDVVDAIEKWTSLVPEHGWSNWVLGNHDQHRVASRVGKELTDAMNMLLTLLPGTAITYNGEEIGMLDNRELTVADCQDKMACPQGPNSDEAYFQKESRDFQRTPFHWDSTENAGFCDAGIEPWLPVPKDIDHIDVRSEESVRKSHLFIYKRLAKLRNEPAIQSGEFSKIILNDNVLCISRKNDSYAYLLLINFDKLPQIVNVAEKHEDVGAVKETISSETQNVINIQYMFLFILSLLGKSALVLEGALRKKSTEPEDLKWWQKGIIYQIYPRSFQDSDGDGIGDLPGITSRLQYIRDLGVSAIWLSPIFSSPDWDMGYDISDFKNINDIFGTLGDFDEMLQEAHRLGLKVILDFVPNHSSDEHEWFQRAVREGKNSDYYNYYIWHEGQNDGEDPPNNWGGAFTQEEPGSAWSKYKNPITGAETEWYLHQFHQKQPDLNYRHPALVQAMKDVLSFWVRRGVDGFRVDAINHLVEDEEFRDNTGSDRDMQVNQPLTYEIVKQWRDDPDAGSIR